MLLTHLGLATPERAVVRICDLHGDDIASLPAGLHFGSRYPGMPDTVAVYDFFPAALMTKVSNREHLIGALMFDLWVSNADPRQAIFFRPVIAADVPTPAAQGWVAQLIDNGSLFAGKAWTFRDSVVQGACLRHAAYGPDVSIHAFAPWVDALMDLRFDVLDEVFAQIPPDWVHGDEQALKALLVRLYKRRVQIPHMLEQAVQSLRASHNVLSPLPRYRCNTETRCSVEPDPGGPKGSTLLSP